MKRLFISLTLVACFAMNSYSQEIIVASGHPEAKPFTWVAEKKIVGLGVDLAEIIFPGQNMKVKYKIRPWKRALAELKSGKIGILIDLYWNEERAKNFEFTIPYSEDPISVFVNKNKPFPITKWDDLISRSGCVPIGESYGEKLDRFVEEKLKVDKAYDLKQCLTVLEKERVDYVIFSKYHVQMELRKMGISDKIDALPYNMTSQKVYMAFSRKSPFIKLVPKVNAEITRLKENGTIQKLLEKAIIKASQE